MLFWTGTGDCHLTYLPRKPTPLGLMAKTAVDGASGILLNLEFDEGAASMDKREYNEEFGKPAGVVLRLLKFVFGSGRVVLADGWFGSTRLAYALLGVGLYTIANVKTSHKGFPKAQMKSELSVRGDTTHKQVRVEGRQLYASGHMDK